MSDTRRRRYAAVLVPVAGAAVAVAAMVWASQPWRGSTPSPVDVFTLLLFGFALLPHVLIALGLVLGRSVGWVWWSALAYGIIASAGGILVDILIITSDSSTAALGFLSLPVCQLIGMVLAAMIAGLLGWRSSRGHDHNSGIG